MSIDGIVGAIESAYLRDWLRKIEFGSVPMKFANALRSIYATDYTDDEWTELMDYYRGGEDGEKKARLIAQKMFLRKIFSECLGNDFFEFLREEGRRFKKNAVIYGTLAVYKPPVHRYTRETMLAALGNKCLPVGKRKYRAKKLAENCLSCKHYTSSCYDPKRDCRTSSVCHNGWEAME